MCLSCYRFKSYDDPDPDGKTVEFKPRRKPTGPQLNLSRQETHTFTRAIDFFKLYFTPAIVQVYVKSFYVQMSSNYRNLYLCIFSL